MAEHLETSQPAALRVLQRCDLDEVRRTAEAVRQFLAAQRVCPSEIADLELVLVEGCNNAVQYTPVAAQSLPVVVNCLCDGHTVELRVHDHTEGFDWPNQVGLPADESERGRGIFLMTRLMKEVNYFRAVGENILIMRRELTAPVEPRAEATQSESDRIIADMVEELSSCYESLSAIFRHSAVRTSASELKDFARRLLDDLRQITGANWYVLRLKSRTDEKLETFVASDAALQLMPVKITDGTTNAVELASVAQRRDVWFGGEHLLSPTDLLAIRADSHGLVHPIFAGENLVGTLAMGKVLPLETANLRPAFTAGHTNVIGTFSEFLASQVLNAQVQEDRVTRRLVEHELAIAASIQQSLLPRELPQLLGLQLAAFCRSAREVGGDFYDVLRIGEREILVVIADVMGKGIPAAMFAAILRTLVRALPELAREPAALMTRINRLLFSELSSVDMFITAQFVFLDVASGRLALANAGHCPLLVASAGRDRAVCEIAPAGIPLGVQEDAVFIGETLSLMTPTHVLLYTDGLPEALHPGGEAFGGERLKKWLQSSVDAKLAAEAAKLSLITTVQNFQSNLTLNDDETFLIMALQNS